MIRKIRSSILGFAAGLLLVAGLASAAAIDYGWNPTTGLEAFHGALVTQGTAPVVSGSCGTRGTITAGPNAGSIVSGAVTTCTTTLTFPSAAPNGWNCVFNNRTTPADIVTEASTTTTSCTTVAATIVSGDVLQFVAIGY
jgi:hypothetical protein